MRVENNVSHPSFKNVFVSESAAKLLKDGDKYIHNNPVKSYFVFNLPDKCDRPLWSAMERQITKRQADNQNHISIDTIIEKGKELLSIVTLDKRQHIHSKQIVSHKVRIGTKTDLFDKVIGSQWADFNLYGKSPLFEAIEIAENQVNTLHNLDLEKTAAKKVSARLLPKQEKIKVPNGQSKKSQAKKLKKAAEKEATEKKVEQFLVTPQELPKKVKIKIPKLAPSDKERVPRKLKKEQNKKGNHINKLV